MYEKELAPSHKSIEATQNEKSEIYTKSKNYLKKIIVQFCGDQPNEEYTALDEQIESILNRTDCFTIFPFLFTSMLESEVKEKSTISQAALEATNGFRMLGNLQKLLYGKLLIGKPTCDMSL
jgi:hypothetical protein